MSDTVTVPVSWLDKLFNRQPEQPEAPRVEQPKREEHTAPAVDVEKFAAIQAERDEYAAKIQQMEADAAKRARVDQFSTALKETALAGDAEVVELLAGLDDETAGVIVARFSALSAQINESALTAPVGGKATGGITDPVQALDAAAKARAALDNIDYNTALARVVSERPELYTAAYGG